MADSRLVCSGQAHDRHILALISLAALSLPLLVMMLLIRLETPGRAVFRQRRVGFANVGFEMWKFRTMYEHAPGQDRLVQATRDDPRVTPLGRWLRRTSLDEIPQLINVLRGDMSLVGPRPHAPGTCVGDKPFEMITPHYPARHRVHPGMTGLAQVRGLRGETETEQKLIQRIAADLEYIEHWSLLLDLKILLRTVATLFSAQNAY
jgi:lipopolysaccharide/colanic/teichoic acid biosynthesis glycosyltransferase